MCLLQLIDCLSWRMKLTLGAQRGPGWSGAHVSLSISKFLPCPGSVLLEVLMLQDRALWPLGCLPPAEDSEKGLRLSQQGKS